VFFSLLSLSISQRLNGVHHLVVSGSNCEGPVGAASAYPATLRRPLVDRSATARTNCPPSFPNSRRAAPAFSLLGWIIVTAAALSIGMAPACGSRNPSSQANANGSGDQASLATYNGDITSRKDIPFFILVGDTQRTSGFEILAGREQNDAARQLVLDKIAEENPAFLVILGDLVFQGDDPSQWDRFDEFAASIRRREIPVFPLLGNHEYFGSHKKAFDFLFSRFPHLHGEFWNAVRFGPVAVVLLDSNFERMGRDLVDRQNEWYRQRLAEYEADSNIKTVLVCCHHAPFTNSTVVSDDAEVQQRFVEPFKSSAKAKLFFTGHCHSYERFAMFGKQFVVSGGGGGPRQTLETDPQKRRHQDQYPGREIREFHFCKVSLEQQRLRVRMIRIDDSLEHWSVGDDFLVE
jgi:Icc-related predicted phosphoesterase